jgi:hypothetical protein
MMILSFMLCDGCTYNMYVLVLQFTNTTIKSLFICESDYIFIFRRAVVLSMFSSLSIYKGVVNKVLDRRQMSRHEIVNIVIFDTYKHNYGPDYLLAGATDL